MKALVKNSLPPNVGKAPTDAKIQQEGSADGNVGSWAKEVRERIHGYVQKSRMKDAPTRAFPDLKMRLVLRCRHVRMFRGPAATIPPVID